jgi:hypothetical protein
MAARVLERSSPMTRTEANKQITGIEIIKAPRQRTEKSGRSLRREGESLEAFIIKNAPIGS